MTFGEIAGVPGLTPCDASAALALVTAATESRYEVVGFFAGKGGFKKKGRSVWAGYTDGLTPLAIGPRQRLDDVVKTVSDLPFGGTDCALPMLYARALKREVDTFVVMTDSESWGRWRSSGAGAGGLPPSLADRRPPGRGRPGRERSLDRGSRCSLPLRFRRERHCLDCGKATPHLVVRVDALDLAPR
jgi:hypothetical protein